MKECFACGMENGFKIFTSNPCKETFTRGDVFYLI